MKSKTPKRKLEHLQICSDEDVETKNKTAGFECVDFVHQALPEIDKDSINLSTTLFNKKLNFPIIITGMTGGHESSYEINKNLAIAAQKLGIGMGLGSQRAMIEDSKLAYTYKVRDVAPDILLIGNLGAPQAENYTKEQIEKAMQEVGADVLAIHLNALQEVLQPEGETKAKGFAKVISDLAKNSKIPVMVKETGAGISRETAQTLLNTKIAGIDVGGAGGTSFAAVEILRTKNSKAMEFWDWGIPTAASILEVRSVSKEIPLIATGGIRSGTDTAKALALGADAIGIGLPLLEPAKQSPEKVVSKLNEIIDGLRTAMFLVGAKDLSELKNKKVVTSGRLFEWLKSRKINL